MDPQPLARKELVRAFYVQGRHVMLLRGLKPGGSEVELTESHTPQGTAVLQLRLTDPGRAEATDAYYLVQPVFAPGPMKPCIRLQHENGCDAVPVSPMNCAACRVVTGSSQTFCFDDAFADALRQLPPFSSAPPEAPIPLVDVLAMGAVYGGFSGFSRLFLRLQVATPDPPEGQ